jgi:hypothetical protein
MDVSVMLSMAALGISGVTLGMVAFRPKRPKPSQPVCGCDHHLALHDENGCHGTRQVAVGFLAHSGKPVDWVERPCLCRQFVLSDDMSAGLLGPGQHWRT